MYQYSNCNLPRAFDNFLLLQAEDTIMVLVWRQNLHSFFQKLEQTMENLTSDILVRKFGTRLMSS